MYESFFGLRERPFDLVPNPRFLYLTSVHREALSTLTYALNGPGGLTLLVGDAGLGKTTLIRTALASLGDDRVQCVLISNPTLSRDEFYEFLTDGFGLEPAARQSKTRFLAALRRHAEERLAEGKLTALLLDEAQSVPEDLLEEVRLLSNMETSTSKLLNVVLAGQPELAARLNDTRLRHLKQRIGLRCQLKPFDASQTAAYIAGRLRIAGGSPSAIFTREAVDALHSASRGVPRVINVICENALLGAFGEQVKPLTRAFIDDVVRDFDLASGQFVAPPGLGDETPDALPADRAGRQEPGDTSADSSGAASILNMFARRKPASFFTFF